MLSTDAAAIKRAAAGRWRDILPAVAKLPAEVLDGRHHPCPRCGGTDRFRALDDFNETGAVLCNQCFSKGNGDGLAAIQWMLGVSFPEACRLVGGFLGLTGHVVHDVEPVRRPAANGQANGRSRIVAQYDYRDEAGSVLFQAVRYEPKDFKQRRPDGQGRWTWSVKGVPQVPYRLPELVAASADVPVYVAEGEKDADALALLGLVATCNAGGAGKWTAAHAEYLRGRRVVVLADNDDVGRNHAQQVAQSLEDVAESARIVELPGLPDKGDVSDWIAAGGTKDELKRLAEAAPVWAPAAPLEPGPVSVCLADVEPRAVEWLWPGRIPLGRLTLLVGRPGEGKSYLTMDLAARVSTGTPWPDGTSCERGSVLLLTAEDDPADTIRPRLDAHHADVARVHLLSAVRRVDDEGAHERIITLGDLDAIGAVLERLGDCRLVVIDPIGSYLGGRVDSHRDNEVRSVLAPIAALAERYGAAVLVVAHRRKSAGLAADDLALGSRAFTGVARAVWHLSRDPEDISRRLLLPGKCNLAAEGDGLAFAIVGEPPRICWEREPVAMTADDGLAAEYAAAAAQRAKPGPQSEALEEAKTWLAAALADGPRSTKDLEDEWVNGEGGSKRTLERAKAEMRVEALREKVPGPWLWRLPAKDAKPEPKDANDVPPGDLGGLAKNTGNLAVFDGGEPKAAKIERLGGLGPKRARVTI